MSGVAIRRFVVRSIHQFIQGAQGLKSRNVRRAQNTNTVMRYGGIIRKRPIL